jgi:hypothetical protein
MDFVDLVDHVKLSKLNITLYNINIILILFGCFIFFCFRETVFFNVISLEKISIPHLEEGRGNIYIVEIKT